MGQGSKKQTKGLFQARSPAIGGRAGVYHVDYLTSVNQEIPDWNFIIPLLEESETTIRLQTKFWCADLGVT